MLNFLYIAVSWVLLRWHDLFTLIGFSDSSGLGWALSIVFLVITARVLLFRLFIKQVHYTRNMQKMQPKIAKLREKHKNDRATLNREMMALQQEEGFNPLSGCLPMVLQIPVFIGLYHTLRHLSNAAAPRGSTNLKSTICYTYAHSPGHISQKAQDLLSAYTFSPSETCHAANAQIFNAPLAASFRDPSSLIRLLGGDPVATRVLLVVLLVISAAATVLTQLLVRASATTTPEGTAATVQRLMIYVIPIGVLVSGLLFAFPLGVLLYWFTSNIWTLGQQAYIVRFHPPVDEPEKPVGELGKKLAPKVGQKPVRPARTSLLKDNDDADEPGEILTSKGQQQVGDKSMSSSAARGSTPRPGQRPNRSSGKRPPAKRPTQSKKRR